MNVQNILNQSQCAKTDWEIIKSDFPKSRSFLDTNSYLVLVCQNDQCQLEDFMNSTLETLYAHQEFVKSSSESAKLVFWKDKEKLINEQLTKAYSEEERQVLESQLLSISRKIASINYKALEMVPCWFEIRFTRPNYALIDRLLKHPLVYKSSFALRIVLNPGGIFFDSPRAEVPWGSYQRTYEYPYLLPTVYNSADYFLKRIGLKNINGDEKEGIIKFDLEIASGIFQIEVYCNQSPRFLTLRSPKFDIDTAKRAQILENNTYPSGGSFCFTSAGVFFQTTIHVGDNRLKEDVLAQAIDIMRITLKSQPWSLQIEKEAPQNDQSQLNFGLNKKS